MKFKSSLENFQKYKNFPEIKQSQYGRYFRRGTDDSNAFASEHIRLKPVGGKQETNKKKLKKEIIVLGEEHLR